MTAEVAIVTGGGSGIGAATCVRLARRGARVAVLDRSADGARRTVAAVAAAGGEALAVEVDVADVDAMRDAVDAATRRFGLATTAIACAGIVAVGDAVQTSTADWTRVLAVNLGGVFHLAHVVLPALVQTRGTFCAVSSEAGVAAWPGISAYSTSKHAVIGFVRTLAVDFGPRGVRSNVVCPGSVETPLLHESIGLTSEADLVAWHAAVPLGRFAQPDEIASVIAHLTSADASYVNGLVYLADGGGAAGRTG